MPETRFPGLYFGIKSLAFGRDGLPAVPVDLTAPMPVRSLPQPRPTYRSGVVGFTPVAAATDIACLMPMFYGRVGLVEQITISGTATAAAVLDVLIQRSSNGGGGTLVGQPSARLDARDRAPTIAFQTFTANRTANGNGIDSTRPLVAAAKLHLGTASVTGQPVTIRFAGDKRPMLRDLTEWLVFNVNGQTLPTGTSLNIFVEWSEQAIPPVQFAGDRHSLNALAQWGQVNSTEPINLIYWRFVQ